MAKRKTGKRGAPFGSKHAKEAKKLVNFEAIAEFEGVKSSSISSKLKTADQTLFDYLKNLIKNYDVGLEKALVEAGAAKKKKDRIVTIEAFLFSRLKKIYEENPELRSQRRKPNSLNQDLQE